MNLILTVVLCYFCFKLLFLSLICLSFTIISQIDLHLTIISWKPMRGYINSMYYPTIPLHRIPPIFFHTIKYRHYNPEH